MGPRRPSDATKQTAKKPRMASTSVVLKVLGMRHAMVRANIGQLPSQSPAKVDAKLDPLPVSCVAAALWAFSMQVQCWSSIDVLSNSGQWLHHHAARRKRRDITKHGHRA